MINKLYCKFPHCDDVAALDDGFPNYQYVRGDDGKYRMEDVGWPDYCERHDLRLRWWAFQRDVIRLTRA